MWHLFEEQEEGVHIAIRAAEFALLLSRILLAVANKSVFSSCFFVLSHALALAVASTLAALAFALSSALAATFTAFSARRATLAHARMHL
jgi:hypothetical protein